MYVFHYISYKDCIQAGLSRQSFMKDFEINFIKLYSLASLAVRQKKDFDGAKT